MALQPISNLGIAGPLSGTAQPNNFGAPANWVPGNGPPPGMTWSETQGQWMPSDSVVGAMPGPVASPIDNTLPIKFGMEPPNSNPYGFTAPTGPAASVMVPYYNKVTGQTWSAPSGGYTPPSADWLQGSPNPQISPGGVMPMPGFAPGMDPVKPDPGPFAPAGRAPTNGIIKETLVPDGKGGFYDTASPPQMSKAMPSTYEAYLAQQGPQMTMELKPWQQGQYAGMDNKTAYEKWVQTPEAQPTPIGGTTAPSGGSGLSGLIAPTLPVPMPQQPAPTPNKGGLGSLLTPQRPVQTPVVNSPPQNTGGLNSLVRPQTPVNTGLLGSTQPVTRNQFAPRAGSLPSLRIRPTFKRSLPIPFAKPPFRR